MLVACLNVYGPKVVSTIWGFFSTIVTSHRMCTNIHNGCHFFSRCGYPSGVLNNSHSFYGGSFFSFFSIPGLFYFAFFQDVTQYQFNFDFWVLDVILVFSDSLFGQFATYLETKNCCNFKVKQPIDCSEKRKQKSWTK